MIRLWIKGTEQEASAAMESRKLLGYLIFDFSCRFGATAAVTDSTDRDKVITWFREGDTAPYPPGTLLHYQLYYEGPRMLGRPKG